MGQQTKNDIAGKGFAGLLPIDEADLLHTQTHRIHGTGIFTYIYHKNQPNVGKYTIHGSYGKTSGGSFNQNFRIAFFFKLGYDKDAKICGNLLRDFDCNSDLLCIAWVGVL